jgi:aryl-alcohol dehydrogenase-like predicted oxidoreductase
LQQRALGNSGLLVSIVGLGCNNFGRSADLAASQRIVHKALDLGITLFDTADIYGNRGDSEAYLGQILGARRKDIILATKFGMAMDDAEALKGASRHYIMHAVDASLRRLRCEWIDLYQLHRPDSLTPIDETLTALNDLIRQGKVRYIGCSNLAAWQVIEAQMTAKSLGLEAFVSCQDEYSLLARAPERDLIPAMEAHGLRLLPYFPLASGLLTGKYHRNATLPEGTRLASIEKFAKRFLTAKNWRVVERLAPFCASRGRSLLELAFSWLAARTTVSSIIAGASSPLQVEQNVRSVEWTLTPEDLAEIDRMTGTA